MSERFYVNLPLTVGPFILDGPEAHHLATVCRLRAGTEVCLFNGDGCEYPARITQAARREVVVEILGVEKPDRELPLFLEVAAPLPKGDRTQFLIEKLTELGVTQFVPLGCAYSNAHPRESKREKLERYVIEASKQCGRNVLMKVGDLTDWKDHLKPGIPGEIRLLAHPGGAAGNVPLAIHAHNTRIAVGPEGGFTDEEVALAMASGWLPVDLGPRILRVETAAITLVAQMLYSHL